MRDLEKLKKSLRNMKQNRDKSDDEITAIAKKQIEEEEFITHLTFCAVDEEREFAKALLTRYLSQRSWENEAEKDTLKQLIDLQILLERIKKKLNENYKDAENITIPLDLVEPLQKLQEQIQDLKVSLGLVNIDTQQADFTEVWNNVKKKTLKYFEEHKGCNEFKCPVCHNIYSLLWDRTNCTEIKSTWFKGTILYNEPLLKLYHNKIISVEQTAEILGVSVWYVDLIYGDLFLKELKEKEKNNNAS